MLSTAVLSGSHPNKTGEGIKAACGTAAMSLNPHLENISVPSVGQALQAPVPGAVVGVGQEEVHCSGCKDLHVFETPWRRQLLTAGCRNLLFS